MRIPNVVIEIPASSFCATSRTLYEPMYVVALIKAYVNNARLPKDHQIRVRGIDPSTLERHFAFTETEGATAEYDRLRARYEIRPGDKAEIFDLVYPGPSFRAAFDEAARSKGLPEYHRRPEEVARHPLDEPTGAPECAKLSGVTEEQAAAMDAAGYGLIERLASARPLDIAAIPGIGARASAIIAEALRAHNAGAPVEETVPAASGDEDGAPLSVKPLAPVILPEG